VEIKKRVAIGKPSGKKQKNRRLPALIGHNPKKHEFVLKLVFFWATYPFLF